MSALPTVKVVANNARGWRIINKSAFDPEVHVLFSGVPAEPVPAEPVPAEPVPLRGKRRSTR